MQGKKKHKFWNFKAQSALIIGTKIEPHIHVGGPWKWSRLCSIDLGGLRSHDHIPALLCPLPPIPWHAATTLETPGGSNRRGGGRTGWPARLLRINIPIIDSKTLEFSLESDCGNCDNDVYVFAQKNHSRFCPYNDCNFFFLLILHFPRPALRLRNWTTAVAHDLERRRTHFLLDINDIKKRLSCKKLKKKKKQKLNKKKRPDGK